MFSKQQICLFVLCCELPCAVCDLHERDTKRKPDK